MRYASLKNTQQRFNKFRRIRTFSHCLSSAYKSSQVCNIGVGTRKLVHLLDTTPSSPTPDWITISWSPLCSELDLIFFSSSIVVESRSSTSHSCTSESTTPSSRVAVQRRKLSIRDVLIDKPLWDFYFVNNLKVVWSFPISFCADWSSVVRSWQASSFSAKVWNC